jgi:hypothetical protein
MLRKSSIRLAGLCVLYLTVGARPVLAGGAEFPAEGGQGLGRGGAYMARADNAWVLSRNPALLSELWGSQASIGGTMGFSRPCFQPSGGFGWGEESPENGVFVLGKGERPIYPNAEPKSKGGAVGSEPVPLKTNYDLEPYPKVCAAWDPTFSPTFGLTTRVNDELGIGIALMPPEYAMLPQFGKGDGTIDTPFGKRPNPLRYFGSSFSKTYFSVVSAAGYKVLPWLRVGVGLRWTLLMVDTKQWDNALNNRSPANDMLEQMFFQDLFIPGIIGSVHFIPIDNLDIALGYKWEDRVRTTTAKMDVTTNVYGYGEPFQYYSPSGSSTTLPTVAPTMNQNIPLTINAPPITPPQLSFAIRYADRIKPRPEKYTGMEKRSDQVRDSLSDEKWDIEFDAIYYFNSAKDKMTITFDRDETLQETIVPVTGKSYRNTITPGDCPKGNATDKRSVDCPVQTTSVYKYGGRDQISLRLGGDYNLIPGVLAVRSGVSWENRGIDVRYADPMYSYPFMRFGIHLGFTWRIDERTDVSISYAHFFQETVELAINDSAGGGLPARFMTDGDKKLSQEELRAKYHIVAKGDGVAQYKAFGNQYYLNAGSHYLDLDVLGGNLLRHF